MLDRLNCAALGFYDTSDSQSCVTIIPTKMARHQMAHRASWPRAVSPGVAIGLARSSGKRLPSSIYTQERRRESMAMSILKEVGRARGSGVASGGLLVASSGAQS